MIEITEIIYCQNDRRPRSSLFLPSSLLIDRSMGHTISTYHDIKMKGTEYLRGIYLVAGLSIKPKTRLSKIDALKEIVRAWGLNPEEILTRNALTEPHRTIIDHSHLESSQLVQLAAALRQQMLKEIREDQPEKVQSLA